MKPRKLIDAAMKAQNVESRYALHKLTGISEQALYGYANGKRWPDNNVARVLAEAAGLNWAEVIAALEEEKATDEATRSAWGKALATIRRGSAGIAGFVAAIALSQALVFRQDPPPTSGAYDDNFRFC